MNLKDYQSLFPDGTCPVQPGYSLSWRPLVREGVFLFTPETAHNWSCPWPFNAAAYCLFHDMIPGEPGFRGVPDGPYRLFVYGDDDTSFTMWFGTQTEAEEFIDLLEGVGPLDFKKDFLSYPWTFTN